MSEFCVELVVVVTMVSCLMGLDIWLLFVRSLLPGVGNGGSVLFGGGGHVECVGWIEFSILDNTFRLYLKRVLYCIVRAILKKDDQIARIMGELGLNQPIAFLLR